MLCTASWVACWVSLGAVYDRHVCAVQKQSRDVTRDASTVKLVATQRVTHAVRSGLSRDARSVHPAASAPMPGAPPVREPCWTRLLIPF